MRKHFIVTLFMVIVPTTEDKKINPINLENLSKSFALKAKTLGGKMRNF
jgi:hypothetical protein